MAIAEKTVFFSGLTNKHYDTREEAEAAEQKELLIQLLESDSVLSRYDAEQAVDVVMKVYNLVPKEM